MRRLGFILTGALLGTLGGCGGSGGGDGVGVLVDVTLSNYTGQTYVDGGALPGGAAVGDLNTDGPPVEEFGLRTLLEFQLGRIPVASILVSATLEFDVEDAPQGDPSAFGALYAVRPDAGFFFGFPDVLPADAVVLAAPVGGLATLRTADVTALVAAATIAGNDSVVSLGVRFTSDTDNDGVDDYYQIEHARLVLRIRTP